MDKQTIAEFSTEFSANFSEALGSLPADGVIFWGVIIFIAWMIWA
jgi:uncharacterized membrane protein